LQEEPVEALDVERAGQLAAVGIVKGRPFAPDDRMRAILENAARIGGGMSRAIAYAPRDSEAVPTARGGTASSAAATSSCATASGYSMPERSSTTSPPSSPPAMAHAQVGAGSAYTIHDAHGDVLDGARTYKLHVEPDPPAKNVWAVDLYDTQTRSLIQVDSTIHPALASNSGTLHANADGSHDLYFGPEAPSGKEMNWVETTPGKSWFPLFRLYGPLQPWFDQTWRLSEFQPVA